MKKTILILNIVLFLSTFCFGQIMISRQEFEKLVYYANFKYGQKFIDKKVLLKNNFEKVKPKLDKVKLVCPQTKLNFEKIKELLSNNPPALQHAKKINKRKVKYYKFLKNEALLQSLITSVWNNVDLSKTESNNQNELLAKYSSVKGKNNIKVSENDVVRAQKIQTASQDWGLVVLLLLFFAVVVLLIKLTSKKHIINIVSNSKCIEEKINKLKGDTEKIEEYKQTEADKNIIVDRELENNRLNESENQNENIENKTGKNETQKKSSKYLSGQKENTFTIVNDSSENSFFELYDEVDNTAFFKFNGNEAEAIANRIFSGNDVSTLTGSYENSCRVITVTPGKVIRNGNKWEVIEKVKIKLE